MKLTMSDKDGTVPVPVPFAHSYWVVPGKFLAGYYPGDTDPEEALKKLKGLLHAGIRHVINLMEEDERDMFMRPFIPYQEIFRRLAREMACTVTCVSMPIRDVDIPSRQEMRLILDGIDRAIAQERPVYVHCLGGKGRTGTVVGCYLARHGLANGEEALLMIRELRRNHPEARITSPETHDQRDFVKSWKMGE